MIHRRSKVSIGPIILFICTIASPVCAAAVAAPASAPATRPSLPPAQRVLEQTLAQPDDYFTSADGIARVQNIISWQNSNGGWWKTYDPTIPRPPDLPTADELRGGAHDHESDWRRTSTIDNGATCTEMHILARAQRITDRQADRDAFLKGLKFLFDAQYPNGGWPQRFPLESNYGRRITFNDRAMVNVMSLLKEIENGGVRGADYTFVGEADRRRCHEAFERGVDCILNCQIKTHGKLTAWCQQHDEKTFEPAGARSYELPSLTAFESSDIVLLLMQREKPTAREGEAIESAVAWLESCKIAGKRYDKLTAPSGKVLDRVLVDDPSAPPLWARFYDIDTNKPFFCDRDGVKRDSIAQVGQERRAGYMWYGTWGNKVLAEYPQWKQRVGAK